MLKPSSQLNVNNSQEHAIVAWWHSSVDLFAWMLLILGCSAGSGGDPLGRPSESPFFLLGKVVMQQSYVCALIAMMVTISIRTISIRSASLRVTAGHVVMLCFPRRSGLEHHVPQLADVCAAAVGVSHLDPAFQVLVPCSVVNSKLNVPAWQDF